SRAQVGCNASRRSWSSLLRLLAMVFRALVRLRIVAPAVTLGQRLVRDLVVWIRLEHRTQPLYRFAETAKAHADETALSMHFRFLPGGRGLVERGAQLLDVAVHGAILTLVDFGLGHVAKQSMAPSLQKEEHRRLARIGGFRNGHFVEGSQRLLGLAFFK